ncbi:MAG TPA: ATP-binding cassette domain-containing protein [bacterium]|nr:ATP-binding cassette domain-containing protein [bacterium]
MRVDFRDIHKSFGPVQANAGVSLTAEAGTIHGILGENGAGKSTLMKILSGFLAPDRGQILLDGIPVRIASPAAAVHLGIGMLHQDPLDFPTLSVLDNFLLGSPGPLVSDRRRAREALTTLAAEFGFGLDPDALCGSLTIGERQQLEILRLLWLGIRILILDEPTTAISVGQKSKLFDALRRMAEQGKVIFFVSHKLEEVQALCTGVTVLRRGRVAGTVTMPSETRNLVHLMFGRTLPPGRRARIPLGPPALDLVHVTVSDARLTLSDVSLTVSAGEVVGLAGLEGSGQRLLLHACAGLARPISGRVHIAGRDMTGSSYRQFLAAGVAYVPAGRLDEGLISGLTFLEHVVLADRQARVFVRWGGAAAAAARVIQEFNIRATPRTSVKDLSGGNQQRALLALLPSRVSVLLMEHPTRGLDVESSEETWSRLLTRRTQGTAIIFSSSDLDELLERSDRILVFSGGRVAAPLDARQTTAERLGELIGGTGA